MRLHEIPSVALCLCLASLPTAAQEGGGQEGEIDQAQTIQELRARIAALEEKQTDEVDDLRFELETLQIELEKLQARAQSEPQRTNVFNPSITVFGNFLGRYDSMPVFLDNDPAEPRIDNRFSLREVELDFRASIDPWADGVVIAALAAEVPGEYDATIEEGYVALKQLPVLDSAPAGLKLKAGRYRTEFGRLNLIHLHDLPWPTRPRSYTNLFGEAQIGDGISGQFFLPAPSESQSLEATLQWTNGGSLPIAADTSQSKMSGLGNLKWFADLGNGKDLQLGATGWTNGSNTNQYGVDATFKWKPFKAGESRSFLLGGEFYGVDADAAGIAPDPIGWYAWTQYQFNRNVYAGVRYDHAEELTNSNLKTDTIGAYLTYYTTEFLRFRVGYEHTESDLASLDGLDTILFELNFVFGSHPVEPYWVNR